MKSLKMLFVTALVWSVAGMSVVACSKKTAGGGGGCQPGFISQNGTCIYDPSNPGNGGGIGGGGTYYGYAPNGTYQNGSQFRDFTILVNGYTYRYYGSGENKLQVKLLNSGSSQATIAITTPQFVMQTQNFTGYKFVDSVTQQTGYEIYHNNPYYHKVGELLITSGNIETSTQVNYVFSFFSNNSSSTPIMSGVMRKGIDF